MTYKVFGKAVKVFRRDLLTHGLMGIFEGSKNRITIDQTLKGQDYDHTLIHELVHALWARLGMLQTGVPHEVQELLCENFATMMIENFKITKK